MLSMAVNYTIENKLDHGQLVPNIKKRLFINMKVAGKYTEERIRKRMRSGKYEKNSAPWTAAKGSGRSLYHTGHLSTKIKHQVIPGAGNILIVLRVGWLTNPIHSGRANKSIGVQKIVNWLTNPQSWKPTRAQRAAFWAQIPKEWKKSNPIQPAPIWKTPARDFMTDVANDTAVRAMILKMTKMATKEALEGKK